MRITTFAFGLILASSPAVAQVVPYSQASAHVGQSVTVEGPVAQVFTSRKGDTFIDIGGRYPSQAFQGVIFRSNSGMVGAVQDLEGKTVDLTGVVRTYRGRPEIIITSPSQIRAK